MAFKATTKIKAVRAAVLTADAVEVGCPACGEPQPDPEIGSHMWTPEQIKAAAGQRLTCTSCDAIMFIDATRKATIEYGA